MIADKCMTAGEILGLYHSSEMRPIISPDFCSRSKEEQRQLIQKIPLFQKEGIDPERVIDASRNYYYFSLDFLVNELKELYARVITKQDNGGGWPLVDRDYLISIRSYSIGEIDAYMENYRGTYNRIYQTDVKDAQEVLVPTYWSNYLVILLLNKWRLCVSNNPHMNYGCSLEQLDEAIRKGSEWLKNNSLNPGWSFTHKVVSHTLNTYDTSMALIAINYHMSFFDQNTEKVQEEFFGKDHLEALIHSRVRNKNGSWRKEIDVENEDTGATSYAVQCLMKYHKRGKDQKFRETILPFISDGIEWLVKNQREYDGGWGEEEKGKGKQSHIEKSSYALMALVKYRKMFFDFSLDKPIEDAISFVKKQAKPYKYYPVGCVWPNDYARRAKQPEEWEDSLKNSSLAISSLIRADVPFEDLVIKKGVIGASRLYEITYEDSATKYWYNPIYYFCMLADCLKMFQ